MNFELTEEQLMIQQMAREFAQEKIAPTAVERDISTDFPYDVIEEMGGDNSEQNKKKKFEEVLDETLLGYVNTQFDFYQKLENPRVKSILMDVIHIQYGRDVQI